MSLVSLAMDALLAVLLLTAVAVGLRLNGKLKLLRDGQGQFVRAVADLDAAAARAESGLSALRGATEEAHDALLTRIETARGLLPRLDRAGEDAASAVARLEEGVRAADAAARRTHAAAAAAAAESASPRLAARERSAPAEALRAPVAAGAEPIPFPTPRRDPPVRGLADALAVAERITEAEAPAFSAPLRPAAPPASAGAASGLPAAPADGRLARFVARRRESRS